MEDYTSALTKIKTELSNGKDIFELIMPFLQPFYEKYQKMDLANFHSEINFVETEQLFDFLHQCFLFEYEILVNELKNENIPITNDMQNNLDKHVEFIDNLKYISTSIMLEKDNVELSPPLKITFSKVHDYLQEKNKEMDDLNNTMKQLSNTLENLATSLNEIVNKVPT